jgi:amidase
MYMQKPLVTYFQSKQHFPIMSSITWESSVAAKQKSSLDKIPAEWRLPTSVTNALEMPLAERSNHLMEMDIPRKSGVMTDRELEITERLTVEELLSGLKGGTFSSLEVTLAFSKRAAIAQQLVSCLHSRYFRT